MPAGDNPFEVLDLASDASRMDIERRKHKLLGMLELGLADAQHFVAAEGERQRTAEMVRQAFDALSAPHTRLAWELWTPRETHDALDRALVRHREVERAVRRQGERITAADLEELGIAWDLAFESEDVSDRAATRAQALGVTDVDAVVEAFRHELENALVELLRAAPPLDLSSADAPPLAEATERFHNELIERLELACERHIAAAADDWAELTGQYARTVRGRGALFRFTAFQAVYEQLAEHAVALAENGEHDRAATRFFWLSNEAARVGDAEAADLQRENGETCNSNAAEEARGEGTGWWIMVLAALIFGSLRTIGGSCDDDRKPPHIEIDPGRLKLDLQPPDLRPADDPGAPSAAE